MPAEQRSFHTLDGLRGIAALVVVCLHTPDRTLWRLLPGGYLAVDLFFILSGFVLAHAYGERLGRGMSVSRFMALRYIRLYPLYAVALGGCVAATAILIVTGHSPASGLDLVASTLMAAFILPTPPGSSVDSTALFPLNGPCWSLFFELVVNLAYACVAAHLSPRRLRLALALIAAVFAASVVYVGQAYGGSLWENFWMGPPRAAFGFLAGVAVHAHWKAHPGRFQAPTWILFAAFVAIVVTPGHGLARIVIDLCAVLLLLPMIVALAARTEPGPSAAALYGILGETSYGVYVLHMPLAAFLGLAAAYAIHANFTVLGIWGSFAIIGGTGASALFLSRFYDLPLRNYLRSRLARSVRPAAAFDQG